MLKRSFDIVLSLFGLIFLSPVLIVISLLIRKEDGGPLFYRGVRVGRDGHLFRVFKFRTMVVDVEKIGARFQRSEDGGQTTELWMVG